MKLEINNSKLSRKLPNIWKSNIFIYVYIYIYIYREIDNKSWVKKKSQWKLGNILNWMMNNNIIFKEGKAKKWINYNLDWLNKNKIGHK